MRIWMIRKELLLGALDMLACALIPLLAMRLRFGEAIPAEHIISYGAYLPILLLCRMFMARFFRLYDFRHRLTFPEHLFGAMAAAFWGVGCGYAIFLLLQLYVSYLIQFSRAVALLEVVLLTLWFVATRTLALRLLHAYGYRIRLVLIGIPQECRQLMKELQDHAPSLIEVTGIISMQSGETDTAVLGSVEELPFLLKEAQIDQAILVTTDLQQAGLRNILSECDRSCVDLFLHPDITLALLASTEVISIAGLPLVALNPDHASTPYGFAKRMLDMVAAICGLLLASPLFLGAAVAVRFSSPGPIFYTQERVGLRQRPFYMYKFRTMKYRAEEESGPTLSVKGDPRLTAAGKWMRRFRIDELPQLWNVLRGDMSLVGPRPERAAFVCDFVRENPLYERRFWVRPGLTGLAQIHGRYDTDYRQKLRYDLIYINRLSFLTDVQILAATIRTVLTGKGV